MSGLADRLAGAGAGAEICYFRGPNLAAERDTAAEAAVAAALAWHVGGTDKNCFRAGDLVQRAVPSDSDRPIFEYLIVTRRLLTEEEVGALRLLELRTRAKWEKAAAERAA